MKKQSRYIKEFWEFLEPGIIPLIALLLFGGVFWAASAYFEAQTYERVTGKKVSTWDAMWLELRVTP